MDSRDLQAARGQPGRATASLAFLAGRIVLLLLLSGHLVACAAGGVGEAGVARSNSPTPAATAERDASPGTAPGNGSPSTALPATNTPAPTNSPQPTASSTTGPTAAPSGEVDNPVLAIPLAGPVADRRAELSGLAWYGDSLIILPQFPDFNEKMGGGFVYALPKEAILAFLDGEDDRPLEPRPVPFVAGGLDAWIAGFEGYEAIAFTGDDVYLTIEARDNGAMLGYLVKGRMDPELTGLVLDASRLAPVASQTGAFNMAEESLFVIDGLVGVIHELNGPRVNPAPVVHLFDLDLSPMGAVAIPGVPFRVTDASAPDAAGRFWAINYFYPGGDELLDLLSTPESNANGDQAWPPWAGLGRLLEFQFSPAGIRPAGTIPIQLETNLGDIHNWEGLVRLDERGFLLVSDEIPGSVLGFVPFPAKVE